jgi:hypothetical protein
VGREREDEERQLQFEKKIKEIYRQKVKKRQMGR